jgi:drug/metabolite transporter (DMT)-like permease
MGLRALIATDADQRRARLAGIALMLAAMLFFAFGDAFGKLMVATYSVGQLLLLRACAGLAVMAPLIWQQRAALMAVERPWLQLARIAVATLEVAAFFLATRYLPLADVITYYLASSLFVTVGASLFLGEDVDRPRLIAVAVGFLGVLIALQPSSQSVSWAALIAIAASALFAALMLITRSLRNTPDMVLAAQQFAGTALLGAVLAPAGWMTPAPIDWLWFALAGIVAAAGLVCVNRSLRLAPASVVVPYQYSMIIWAAVFGYLFFGDIPTLATLVGVVIIIGAGLYIFFREQRGRRAAAAAQPRG